MRQKLLALLLTALTLTGCAATAGAGEYEMIPMSEAAARMESSENYLLVDVRTPEEYAAAHIPGAINVPNETIATEPPADLPDKDQLLFIYCRSGNRSKQAADKLAEMGYTNLVEIGGINDWEGETVSED